MLRTVTFKKRTLIAYEIDESSGDVVHGGQDWEAALGEDQDGPEAPQ